MFDLGWPELLVIVAVAVLVIGPDEIPGIMRALGRIVRRIQYVKFALSQQFDDFMQEHELEEMRSEAIHRKNTTTVDNEKNDDLDQSRPSLKVEGKK